jgi:hypothetical protein
MDGICMIKNIYANGPFLQVEGTGTSYNTPYIPATMPSAGIVRYNNGHLEVYDGTTWHDIGGNGQVMVSMSGNAVNAIMWAENKMQEELHLKELAEKHPAVADAVAQVQQAEDRLQVVAALVEEQKS